MNTDYVTFGDLGALGLDLTAILNAGTNSVTSVKGALDAKAIAKRNAQIAADNARAQAAMSEAERQRTAAILAGNAPKPIDWTKIAIYSALAIGGSIAAVKIVRSFRKRR